MPSIAYPNCLFDKQKWAYAVDVAQLGLGGTPWIDFYVSQYYTHGWTYWGASIYATQIGTLAVRERDTLAEAWKAWPLINIAANTPYNVVWRVTRRMYGIQFSDTSGAPGVYSVALVFQNN